MSQKIIEIKRIFEATSMEKIRELIEKYEEDPREGVKKIITTYKKKEEKLKKEYERIEKMKEFEKKYKDFSYICGIDEVGRGPLAGPVVAAAVILPKESNILYINDSKQLSEKRRESIYKEIMGAALSVGVGVVSPGVIDEINILKATYEAMREAINRLEITPNILLNDAVTIPKVDIKQIGIVKGDARSISIAAASIVAKVTRDRMMIEYETVYPEYHFASNKGYGSKAHIEALREFGPCPIHRETFIKKLL